MRHKFSQLMFRIYTCSIQGVAQHEGVELFNPSQAFITKSKPIIQKYPEAKVKNVRKRHGDALTVVASTNGVESSRVESTNGVVSTNHLSLAHDFE